MSRRERRAQERTAIKEAQRQSKTAEGKDLQGGSLAAPMGSLIQKLQQNALPLLAFLVAIFAFYFPALSGEFIWDDVIFSEEKTIHDWSGLWSIWFAPYEITKEGHYWPVTYTTFWLEHKLYGLNTTGYHIFNCILYFINVVLIWRLLLRLEVPGAWAISMIFTVHPLHVESVAWLIERKSLLAALFCLCAVHVWLRFRESPNLKTYVLALSLYALGLLSKSIAVTLPAALLILLWWKQERVSVQDLMRLLPFFIVGFVIALGDYVFYTSREDPLNIAYSFWERILIAAQAVWFYVGKLLWPANLIAIYPHWDVSVKNPIAWLFVIAMVGVLILLWAYRHRIGKGPLAGVAFFIITLSPVLGFVDHKYMEFSLVANRYQYLAGLGLMAVLVGGTVHAIQPHIISFKPVAMGTFAVLIIGLAILTWGQATTYQDGTTFFRHIVTHNPTSYDAYYNLGVALSRAERIEEAYEANLKAAELRPRDSMVHTNIAHALIHMERYDEAEESLKRALELNPQNDDAWEHYGNLYHKQQRYEEAYEANLKAAELQPYKSVAFSDIARSLIMLKRYDEAEKNVKRALELDPENSGAWQNYGSLHLKQQRYEEAAAVFKTAIDLSSSDKDLILAHGGVADSYYRLGNHKKAMEWIKRAQALTPASSGQGDLSELLVKVLLALGKTEEAEQHMLQATQDGHSEKEVWNLLELHKTFVKQGDTEKASIYLQRILKLAKDNPEVLQRAADTLRKQEQYTKAIEIYKQVLAIDSDFGAAYGAMGDALFRLGRYEEAIESFERSIELNTVPSSAATPFLIMAQAASKLGRSSDANKYYERAIELDPQNVRALESLAMARFREKRYEDALRFITSARDIRPEDARIYSNIGITLYHLGRLEEAIQNYEKALSLDPSMDQIRASVEQLKEQLERQK